MSKAAVATEAQKQTIIDLFEQRHTPIDSHTKWPEPFTEKDADSVIEILKGQIQSIKKNCYA